LDDILGYLYLPNNKKGEKKALIYFPKANINNITIPLDDEEEHVLQLLVFLYFGSSARSQPPHSTQPHIINNSSKILID
jgi:hypothetical protein